MIIELLLDVVISRATSYLSSILFGDGVTLYTQCWGRVCVITFMPNLCGFMSAAGWPVWGKQKVGLDGPSVDVDWVVS